MLGTHPGRTLSATSLASSAFERMEVDSGFFLIHHGSGGPFRLLLAFYNHQLTSRALDQRRLPTEHAAYGCRQKSILVFLPSIHGRIEKRQTT